jgi:hypothetical protein
LSGPDFTSPKLHVIGALRMKDYRSISLIHILGKLFSKVLANRLAPRLQGLVHCS